ncbi:hypothetical protein CGLO_13465 [Colletotrichum gloeosporioides Cg-14]|uniref:Uncharacterized protein n=1 Tax=Colletotrichum gloeosporioides (strain Cg-14) TaxID=1237896 RepID=T0K3N2_COLGC|nr:hypothetical protein CGLO_13465 [Colletotrichum gloeosporioides Cg-14]
MTVKDWQC